MRKAKKGIAKAGLNSSTPQLLPVLHLPSPRSSLLASNSAPQARLLLPLDAAMRILIADDQKDVGRALAELVRICNHEVVGVVGSGLEAIQAYAQHQPDLVLMDYRMPKLNGATACRNILSKDPAARIILVTAWSPSDDSSQSGAIAILPKPVILDRLNALLQIVAETLPAPAPADMPFPEFFDVPAPNSELPSPNSELPAPGSELPSPVSELPSPSFQPDPLPTDAFFPAPGFELPETTFSVDAFPIATPVPQNDLQPVAEARALDEKKIKRPSSRRRVQRARVR